MITMKRGDLLQATEDIIGHQVNCYGAAGGLAAAVFSKWPDAGNDYDQLINRMHRGGGEGWALLGTTQLTGQQPDGHIIANIYGQFYPGEDYRPERLQMALEHLAAMAKALKRSVALPYKLSCGICGGDWDEVLPMIERAMVGVNCAIYKREGDE